MNDRAERDALITAFTDGEATPAEREAVERLLAEDPVAARQFVLERALKRVVQRRVPRPQAPPELLEQVRGRVALEQPQASGAVISLERRTRRVWSRVTWGLAGAVAALLLVTFALIQRRPGPLPAAYQAFLSDLVANHHHRFDEEMPWPEEPAEQAALVNTVEQRLGLRAFAVPELQALGVRCMAIGFGKVTAQPSLVVCYMGKDTAGTPEHVSLVLSRLAEPPEGQSRAHLVQGQKRTYTQAVCDDCAVLYWQEGGVLYSLVADSQQLNLTDIADNMAPSPGTL